MKRCVYRIFICVIIIIGLFGPWLSKYDESYMVKNEKTGDIKIRYHIKIILSPFYISLIKDSKIENISYLVSLGTSFAGSIILLASISSIIKFNKWITFITFIISFLGLIIFFLSLGAGLSIGYKTNIEWGLIITIIGIILNFLYYIFEIIKNITPKEIRL